MKKRNIFFSIAGLLLLGVVIVIILLMALMQIKNAPAAPQIKKQKRIKVRKTEISVELEKNPNVKQMNNEIKAGAFPPVKANYRRDIGFKRYADRIESKGCVFLLYDVAKRKLFLINRHSDKLQLWHSEQLKKFSQNIREIEDEPALNKYKKGFKDCEILLVVTPDFDNRIKDAIIKAANAQKLHIKNVNGFQAFYAIRNYRLVLNVEKAVIKNKGPRNFYVCINL